METKWQFETRGVLAGAYKGRSRASEASLLTHLVNAETDEAVCSKKLNVVDHYGMTADGLDARPTCPRCAKKWDRIEKV